MGVLKRFGTDQRGSTGLLFGLAVLPLIGAVGAAVDYSRAGDAQTKIQGAVDATAIALVREPATSSQAQLDAKARAVFASQYSRPDHVSQPSLRVTRTASAITVTSGASVTNAFMGVLGIPATVVAAKAASTWGSQRIELALVLDNTGSMNDRIGGERKIDALKSSALKLLSDLRAVATDAEAVRVSVVPFDTEVRADPSANRNQAWIRWTNPFDASERNGWTGYLVDRYLPNDANDARPVLSVADTLVPKLAKSQWAALGDLATIQPLTSLYSKASYDAITATITSMKPRGNTNVGLGVAWGTATLTGSLPLAGAATASASGKAAKRFMVVLTDGQNTQKWVNGVAVAPGSASSSDPVLRLINERTREACATAKSPAGAAVEVFTIRLLDGDTGLLQGCASDANHYFDVQDANQLSGAFRSILNAISGTRLTV